MEFSYFDQFKDIEIDLTSYLSYYSTLTNPSGTGINYTFSNIQPVKTTVSNLFTKYDIIFDYTKNIELIIQYEIKENQQVEMVSYDVYGTIDFWWLVYVFNDIKEPFTQWPLTQDEMIKKAQYMYETEAKYTYQIYYDNLISTNNERKQIILPKPDTVKEIVWKYRQAIING
jgi:hypothetical protein